MDNDKVIALDEWIRRIKMVQVAINEPDNQSRINDLLEELKTLEGIFGQVFRLRIEGGYAIRLGIELALVEQQAAARPAADGEEEA